MTHAPQLWVFFVLVFGVVLLPGMDMAFVLASALTGGRRAGFYAVAGIVTGGAFHVAMATLGLSVVVTLIPGALRALLLVGSLYTAWIGISILRAASVVLPDAEAVAARVVFRRAAGTNLSNPKAYLFTLAVIPQFVRPQGNLWFQALVLWLICAVNQVGIYGTLAVVAGQARSFLFRRPRVLVAVQRTVGVLLLIAAVFTAVSGWGSL